MARDLTASVLRRLEGRPSIEAIHGRRHAFVTGLVIAKSFALKEVPLRFGRSSPSPRFSSSCIADKRVGR